MKDTNFFPDDKQYKKDYIKRKSYHKQYNKIRKKQSQEYCKNYRRQRVFKILAFSANHCYKNGKITAFDIWKLAKRQKLRCALTGQRLIRENVSVDHIIPKSKGGINELSNIRLVLKSINIAKQTMTDAEFIELCRGVVNFNSGGTTPATAGVQELLK